MTRHTFTCVLAILVALAGCDAQFANADETAFQALDGGADGGVGGVDGGPAPDSGSDTGESGQQSARVAEGLIAEWQFDTPSPQVQSTRGSVSLTLEQRADPETTAGRPTMSEIADGGILVESGGYYLDAPGPEVYDALTDRDGFSLELWVSSDNRSQRGPARVVSLSQDSSYRNITIGQELEEWSVRFRHDNGDLDPNDQTPYENGLPAIHGPLAFTPQIHVVATFDGYFLTLWQNGQVVASAARPDGIGNWDTSFGLALMNEFEDSRQFVGNLYLFAIWDRALDAREVRQNFLAGPRGDQ